MESSKWVLFLLVSLTILFDLTSAFDGEARDATGCPAAFKGKCHCGNVTHYKYWRSTEAIYIVNCTNTRFTGEVRIVFSFEILQNKLLFRHQNAGVASFGNSGFDLQWQHHPGAGLEHLWHQSTLVNIPV